MHRHGAGLASTWRTTVELLRTTFELLKLLPLLLPGLVLHGPILLVAKLVSERERYPEVRAGSQHGLGGSSCGGAPALTGLSRGARQ